MSKLVILYVICHIYLFVLSLIKCYFYLKGAAPDLFWTLDGTDEQVPGKPASLFSDINLMIIVVVLSCTIVCVGRLCGALHWCWEVLFGAGGLDITKN